MRLAWETQTTCHYDDASTLARICSTHLCGISFRRKKDLCTDPGSATGRDSGGSADLAPGKKWPPVSNFPNPRPLELHDGPNSWAFVGHVTSIHIYRSATAFRSWAC